LSAVTISTTGATCSGASPRRRSAIAVGRDGMLLGALSELLVALNQRVYAQAAEAAVARLRAKAGDREVDFVIQGRGGRTVADEVKPAIAVDGRDVRDLLWPEEHVGRTERATGRLTRAVLGRPPR